MTVQTPVSLPRRMVERLSRHFILRRRLPAAFGHRPIYLSPANRLRALAPDLQSFEPDLFDFVHRFVRPGMTVWDIGANMGAFALPAAHAVGPQGRVVAIEPDPFNQMLLQRSRAHPRNGDLALTIVPAAISNAVALAELEIAARGRAANSLRGAAQGSQMGGVRAVHTVVTLTLDWLAEQLPPPDFIKCDAEGAEAWILQGAERLLSGPRPVIVMEVPRENEAICSDIFARHDYAFFPAGAAVDPQKELLGIGDAWEICAIPRERVADMAGC